MTQLYGENKAKLEVDRIFKIADEDGSGQIDFNEFKNAFVQKGLLLQEENLRKMFDLQDKDGGGTISLEEFKENLVGKQISEDDWNEMVVEIDKDGNGEVDFEEFKNMMQMLLSGGGG